MNIGRKAPSLSAVVIWRQQKWSGSLFKDNPFQKLEIAGNAGKL
jgi:hypothetical protein